MKTYLDWLDYVVLIIILVIPVLIGLFYGVKNNSIRIRSLNRLKSFSQSDKNDINQVSEYLIASSSMNYLPIALSLLASFISTTSLLGMPAEVYQYGIQYWIAVFGLMTAPLFGAYYTGPFFLKLQVKSVFEYFELRFQSKNVRIFGMISYVTKTFISTAIFIYGPATSLHLLNINIKLAIFIIGIIGTFYTAIGGIKAVIWTDLYQIIVMFVSLTIIIIRGVNDIGGLRNLYQINKYGDRLNFFDFNPDPFLRQSFWSLYLGGMVYISMSYCIDQQMIQRFLSAKSKKTAQISLILNTPLLFLIISLCCFIGLILYANFFKCDPLKDKIINPNQILTYYVVSNLKDIPGLSGLFLGALFCGSLSSVSSTLSSLSSIMWHDLFQLFPYFKAFDDAKSVKTTKLLVLFCGILSTLLAFFISQMGGNLIQISSGLNGSFNAPITGLFILGACFSITNSKGAIAGTVVGFLVGLWITFGAFIYKPSYPKLKVEYIDYCEYSNISSNYLYDNYFKASVLEYNRINSSFFYSGQRAVNLSGFNTIYSLSYMWLSTFGTLATIIVGIFVSFLTRTESNPVDTKYILYDFLLSKKLEKKTSNIHLNKMNGHDNTAFEIKS